jgi:predicted  nucleic acid-binding Zn-ribbon protein
MLIGLRFYFQGVLMPRVLKKREYVELVKDWKRVSRELRSAYRKDAKIGYVHLDLVEQLGDLCRRSQRARTEKARNTIDTLRGKLLMQIDQVTEKRRPLKQKIRQLESEQNRLSDQISTLRNRVLHLKNTLNAGAIAKKLQAAQKLRDQALQEEKVILNELQDLEILLRRLGVEC